MPENVIQVKTASVINNLLNRRFLPNRYKIGIVRERYGIIPAEHRKSRQHDYPITESPSDSPKQKQMTHKRILPKKIEYNDLPDDMKHRAELSRRITIISQIQSEGCDKVSKFCGPGDEQMI